MRIPPVLLHNMKRESDRLAVLLGSPCTLEGPRFLLHHSRKVAEFPRIANNAQYGA